MAGAYTVWYREGTVSVTKNSKNVSGVSSYWLSAGLNPGDIFTTDGVNIYEIDTITDSSHLTLKTNYTGDTKSGITYSIIRNFNSGMSARVAALAAQLLGYFDRYIDSDMKSIHGKSAYEIAVSNGYTGTQAQWLESLKAAGEWANASSRLTSLESTASSHASTLSSHTSSITTLNTKTQFITKNDSSVRRNIAGFRDLGTSITDAQRTAIKNDDWWNFGIGDHWTINGHTYYIADFIGHIYGQNSKGIMMYAVCIAEGVMNETATNTGGYWNSYMHQTFLPESVLPILQEDWGDLLCSYYERYISTNASSPANGAGKLASVKNDSNKGYLHLPTFTNIYDYPYPAYPQFDISLNARGQLPLFRLGHSRHTCGWTQNCADNTSKFVYCADHFGNNVWGSPANGPGANGSFVSPLFIIS